MHPSANWEEAFDVDWEKYSERTDMFNVHGNWEWIDRKVYVYKLPLGPHETCSGMIKSQIRLADPERMLISLESIIEYTKETNAGGTGKEADGSYIPWGKLRVNSNGHEGPDSYKPWPNLVIEIASSETEKHLLNAVKNYWLCPGRAHDAIVVKLVKTGTIISRMKVWHFCTDNRTPTGELEPVMVCHIIIISTKCLFHGMPSDFCIFASISNPLIIDFYDVLYDMEEEFRIS
nr:8845_t:CDS:2 [Entrophospora candida]